MLSDLDTTRYTRLDQAFARFMSAKSGLSQPLRAEFESIVKQLSAAQTQGHSCLPVNTDQAALLRQSRLVSSQQHTPLILQHNRLYTQRYWQYEDRLARQIADLSRRRFSYPALETLGQRYFDLDIDGNRAQYHAALDAASQALSIITGGPGTGKTTTVVKILAILQELSQQRLHIALAAPTGKAAQRLQESIGYSKSRLAADQRLLSAIPERVSTVHSLLGAQPPTPAFKYHEHNPLPYDLVVVDEASMIDLALMSKLVASLKTNARLILLGDKDQLASVESGVVLIDLIRSLPENTRELLHTYRFQGEIKALADAVNQQRPDDAWKLLQANEAEIGLVTTDPIAYVLEQYRPYWRLLSGNTEPSALFEAFNQFKVLCSNRHGPLSVSHINNSIELHLKQQHPSINPIWYPGKPVTVTENCTALQLYNGDIGLCLADAEQEGRLSVFFLRPDGSLKKVLPARMPSCETAYALTVHKSQGSEFDHVLIVLAETVNPVLCKELIYTAVTRAKVSVKVRASQEVFYAALRKRVTRHSGLSTKLQHYRRELT